MRTLFVTALLLAIPAVSAERDVVLLANYQTLGVDPVQVQTLDAAFRAALASHPLEVLGADAAEKSKRALVMCGEDAGCQATVGQQANARWVLSYGLGKVGSSTLVSAQLIDVRTSRAVNSASRKEATPVWSTLAKELTAELLRDVPLSVGAAPLVAAGPEVPFEPTPVVIRNEAPARPFRTAAIITGIGTLGFTAATIALGLTASGNYRTLGMTAGEARAPLINRQNTLNLSADLCLAGAIATAAATVVMVILDLVTRAPAESTP